MNIQDNPDEIIDFDIDLSDELVDEGTGGEGDSDTEGGPGGEDDILDIDLSDVLVSNEGPGDDDDDDDDEDKKEDPPELTTEDKVELKKVIEKVSAGFQVKNEELELLTRGGYQWFMPERSNGKIQNWKQLALDVSKYLQEVDNNFPTWDEVQNELNAGGGIVFGKDIQKLERSQWLNKHNKWLESMAVNPENDPRVFNGKWDQFGLNENQDPNDWIFMDADIGKRLVNKNDEIYFPHTKQWKAEDEYFKTGKIPTGYGETPGPWDEKYNDVNRESHYWSSTDNAWKLNPEISLTESKGWNPSQLPISNFENVVKAANKFNQSNYDGMRETPAEDLEYEMLNEGLSPIVFKDGIMVSNIHASPYDQGTGKVDLKNDYSFKTTQHPIDGGPGYYEQNNLLDYELIKNIMFSATPYDEIIGMGSHGKTSKALQDWGFTNKAMQDWRGKADDNLLFVFPWGESMTGSGLTEVGKRKMNDYISQYINTAPQFESARKLLEKELATTLEFDDFNKKLNTLPEAQVYNYQEATTAANNANQLATQWRGEFIEAEAQKIMVDEKVSYEDAITIASLRMPNKAGTPGFSDILSFQELLNNNSETQRKVKAREIQFDHLAHVMKGNLPDNWNQWEADYLIKNIQAATSNEEREKATADYKNWLSDNYGGYFTDNMSHVRLLFDPTTNNFIDYETATGDQKQEWLPAEEYINTLMTQGKIPTNKNQMLELMLDKEFQMVALAQQIFGQEKETTSQIGFGTSVLQGMFVEGQVPDEFLQIREIAKKGELIRDGYERIEGVYNLPAVKRWNELVKEFTILSEAYLMNYNPTTIEKEGFWGGVSAGTSAIVGFDYSTQIDENKAVANALQEIGVDFTQSQLDYLYTPTTLNNIGYGTPGFVMMAGEFALTSWATGGLGLLGMSNKLARVPYMLRNLAKVDKYGKLGLSGYSKFGKVYSGYMGATINNMSHIAIRNGWTSALYDADELSLAFALFAGPGGKLVDDFSKWQLNGSSFWNEVNLLKQQLPGSNLVGGAANVVSKGAVSTGLMTGGELAVVGWETATGEITVEEAHDRIHSTLNPDHLFEVFAQCLILANMNPVKPVREITERAKQDINILTKGKYQRKQYAKSLNAEYDYIFEEGIGLDVQKARIDEARTRMIEKEGGINYNTYKKIKQAADKIGIDFFGFNKAGGWENFNIETFNKVWEGVVAEKGAKNITNEQYAAARQIKTALEQNLGKEIEITSRADQSAKELETQTLLDGMKYEFENELDPGLKMLNWVDNFAKRREKYGETNYNATDIEVLGSLTKAQLEMILGENPTMTRVNISIQGSNIENARKIVAQRNNKGFKPGSKLGNEWIEAAWKQAELRKKQKDLSKDKGEDAGNFNENLEAFYEEQVIKQQEKMDGLEEKNDVLLEEERNKNIELSKKEGNVEAYETGSEFWSRMEEIGEVDALVDLATKTQKEALSVIDTKLEEYSKDTSPEAAKLIEELKAKKAKILDEISIENLEVKGYSIEIDGTPTTILNKAAMRRLKDVSASVHENLHPYFNKILKGKNTNAFISEFKNKLSEYEYRTVLEKVKKHPDFKNGQNPNTIEWLNLYADALIKGELGWNNKTMTAIGDVLETKIRNESEAKNAEIDTPEQVYNFIKNVILPNVKGGKVTPEILDAMTTEVNPDNMGSAALSAKEIKTLDQELSDMQTAKKASIENYLDAVKRKDKNLITTKELEAIKNDHNMLMQQLNPMIKNIEANLTISNNNAENIKKIKEGTDTGDKGYKQLLKDNEGIIGPVLNRWKPGTSKVDKGDWDAMKYMQKWLN